MRFSVISLTHNNLRRTMCCLADVVRHTACRDWELIVVDNGSTDGTPEWQRSVLATECAVRNIPFTPITNPGNIGCSPARNQGIEAARGDFCVFIDNDVSPRTTRWLQGLEAEAAQGAALAGPKFLYPSRPHRIQCAGVGISATGKVAFLGRGQPADACGEPCDVQALISACLLVPRELLLQHGGFDPVFHPVQFEDFDLCYRLRGLGFRARYTPRVEMYHFESSTTQGVSGAANAAVVIRNGLAFKQRWAHCFANENGPADVECRWQTLPPETFDYAGNDMLERL